MLRNFSPTLTNILLPVEFWLGPVGVQYTDMDLRSRENSRVHSFLISCLITCGDKEAELGRAVCTTRLTWDMLGTQHLVLSTLASSPAKPAQHQ